MSRRAASLVLVVVSLVCSAGCSKKEESLDGDAPDPQAAVSLPDARACHRGCVDEGQEAEACRKRCEQACVDQCEGRGRAFAERCAADCRDQLDVVMGQVAP